MDPLFVLEAPTNRQGHETLRNTQSIGIRCMVCYDFTLWAESTLCLPFQPVEDTACKTKFLQRKKNSRSQFNHIFQFLLINELCMEGQVYWNNFHDWFILSQLFWRQYWNLNYIFHLLCTFCHILLNPWSFKS